MNGVGNNINASGQIAGVGAIFNSSNGSLTPLGNPPPNGIQATAINDSSQATGSTQEYAFLYSNGTVTDIIPPAYYGPNSFGTSINASGQVVGVSGSFEGNYGTPFLYTPGQGYSPLPGLNNVTNIAFNDKGQIVESNGTDTYLLSPAFTAFSTLDSQLQLSGTNFIAGGRFVLGSGSNGIDPIKDAMILQLSGYHITIPPSSFALTNGTYLYQGKIGNVSLGMVIRQAAPGVYLYGIQGLGAAALPTSYPVQLTLTIGDDTGTESIASGYTGPAPTTAEACQYFNLDCQ